jgi:predicted  nucleic acid-binding Zn-ribbon protein
VEQVNFQKLNEMVAQVVITNVKEINDLKQEVHELKTKMEDMEKHIKTMNNKINVSEKEAIKESTKVRYQCEECEYNCEDEVNLIKHKTTKHMTYGSKKPNSEVVSDKKKR